MTTSPRAIELSNVHRHFGDRPVLQGLDLQVRPGEIHAFLGRNGSGKTTALRILLGFLQPHRGESRILGVPSQELSPDDRGRIGYVTEGHKLYPAMRVCDTLAFENGTRPRFDLPMAQRAIERCDLPTKKVTYQLSRGQRAQLALIIAIAAQPEILICDDPALGLDVVMRRELLDVMIELLSNRGISVLFSSHFLNDVERIADRVNILHEGRLIVDATLDDLKRRVQKRSWRAAAEHNGMAPPQVPGLLRSRRATLQAGFELTLLDCTPATEAKLQASGAQLSQPIVPDLEDLFLDLTTGDRPSILQPEPSETKTCAHS